MAALLKLGFMFAELSVFAFGGGYVMIPSLMRVSEANHWLKPSELADVIAIAGMTPGPVAVNAAVGYGYKVAGFSGAAAAFLGIAVPCAAIVIITASFFFKIYAHPWVKAALYGLRPVIAGIILYAAASIALKNGIIAAEHGKLIEKGFNVSLGGVNLFELKSLLIAAVTFFILTKTRVQPVFVIIGSGILGMIIF